MILVVAALTGSLAMAADTRLWEEPKPLTLEDWKNGPGGAEKIPQPPFQFVKEDKGGTTPKIQVTDAQNRLYLVKFGPEVNADTFVPRLAMALGYHADATYFVPTGVVQGANHLGRAKSEIDPQGNFKNARFKFLDPNVKFNDARGWSWVSNPFVGSHELNGLRILMLLVSNWDAKDARDGDYNSNNAIFLSKSDPNAPGIYEVDDWGAAMGKWGGFFKREKWDCEGFLQQSENFLRGVNADGTLQWGFTGKHAADMTKGLSADDIRWLLPYLQRITDEQWEAGLTASGGSKADVDCFIRALKSRVTQLGRAANMGR